MNLPPTMLAPPRKSALRRETSAVRKAWHACCIMLASTSGRTPMSVRMRRLAAIQRLWTKHDLAFVINRDGLTLLHVAAYYGRHCDGLVGPFVEFAMSGGIGPNLSTWSSDRWTPLDAAAYYGHEDLCALLLSRGARHEMCTSGFGTPLIVASAQGHIGIVRMLLRAGANIYATDIGKRTAMHHAARNGHCDVVRALHEAGAPLDPCDEIDGPYPLGEAVCAPDASTVRTLLELGADPTLRPTSYFFDTPLHTAAANGNVEACRALLEHFERRRTAGGVDARDFQSLTPLMHARSVECAQLLLEYGADVFATCHEGHNALHFAAIFANPSMVAFLASRGLNAGETILLSLVSNVNAFAEKPEVWDKVAETLRFLCKSLGADVNAKNAQGRTPLHLATYYVCGGRSAPLGVFVCNLLLELGADPNNRALDDGPTPLMVACMSTKFEALDVARAMLEHGAHVDYVCRTVQNGFILSDRNRMTTPLLYAVSCGNISLVHFLLHVGRANVELGIPARWTAEGIGYGGPSVHTPMMAAMSHNEEAMILLLLRYGARIPETLPNSVTVRTETLQFLETWKDGSHPENQTHAATREMMHRHLVPDLVRVVCGFLLVTTPHP